MLSCSNKSQLRPLTTSHGGSSDVNVELSTRVNEQDWGLASRGDILRYDVWLNNDTLFAYDLGHLRRSCGCLTVESAGGVLEPHQYVRIGVSIDTINMSPVPRMYELRIPARGRSESCFLMRFTGSITDKYEVTPRSIDILGVPQSIGGEGHATVRVPSEEAHIQWRATSTLAVNLEITNSNIDHELLTVLARVRPGCAVGVHEGEIRLVAIGEQSVVRLPLRVEVIDDVYSTAHGALIMEPFENGKSEATFRVLTRKPGAVVEVTGARIEGLQAAIDSTSVSYSRLDDGVQVTVVSRQVAAGSTYGRIIIECDDGAKKMIRIPFWVGSSSNSRNR